VAIEESETALETEDEVEKSSTFDRPSNCSNLTERETSVIGAKIWM
jgi:hypothetical protein